jgi:TetR/AcrR family transcriptional regulator
VSKPAFDTRKAILAAAANAFAAAGFAGAAVDEIAAKARVNKAMIYYHFKSKEGLYVEVLREVFRGLGAITADIVGSNRAPGEKVEAFIDALNEMAGTHPYMPPIMMREMAEGAKHLDAETLGYMTRLLRNLAAILDEGARLGVFVPADPTVTYFTLVAPVVFFRATQPIRSAFESAKLANFKGLDHDVFATHLKKLALTALAVPSAPGTPGKAPARPRTRPSARSTRSGDHA